MTGIAVKTTAAEPGQAGFSGPTAPADRTTSSGNAAEGAETNTREGDTPVLVVSTQEPSWCRFGQSLRLASQRKPPRHYCIESVSVGSGAAIDASLKKRLPRLLVIDVTLCDGRSPWSARHVQRCWPDTDLIAAWQAPSPRWTQVLIDSGVKGCIDWSSSLLQMAKAFDAVSRGELWFPRSVSTWLHLELLQHRGHESAFPQDLHAASGTAYLTPREAEVMALVRDGLTNKQIAARLAISANTVKKHLSSAYEKCGFHGRRQAYA